MIENSRCWGNVSTFGGAILVARVTAIVQIITGPFHGYAFAVVAGELGVVQATTATDFVVQFGTIFAFVATPGLWYTCYTVFALVMA